MGTPLIPRFGIRVGTIVGAIAFVAGVASLPAQVALGDSLWRLGRTDEAAAAYAKALESDRNSVRANFRLAQTLAWSQNIDSALVLLRAARERVPDDPDLQFTEATYLSWARRWPDALSRFDSVLAANPSNDFNYVRIARARTLSWAGRLAESEAGYRDVLGRDPADRDARFGLAQLRAWSGDLDGAAARYGELLADDPTEVRVLVALAQVRLWQSRPATARSLLDAARARDSTSGDVRELQTAIAAQLAWRTEVGQFWSSDSDRNGNQWQTVGARRVFGDGIRVGVGVAFLAATDPSRTSRRSMGELTLGLPIGRGTVTASAAVRSLDPAPLAPGGPRVQRTVVSGRLGAQQRLGSTLSVGASLARWPFDEVAAITPLALDIDQWEGVVEWRARPPLTLTTSLGGLDYSDGNRRRTWSARAAHRLPRGLSAGIFATGFGFEHRETRYFSPPRFVAGEVTAAWARETATWSGGLGGGYGAQRIDTLATQAQWHVDARASRQLAKVWTLELTAARSTSAAASAVGAYAYSVLGITVRRTF